MKKSTLAILFVFLNCTLTFASELPSRNVLSMELLGRAGLYSLDFDHLFGDNIALGIGFSAETAPNNYGLTIWNAPIYGNYYFGNTESQPYVSAGLNVGYGSSTLGGSIFTGTLAAVIVGGGYEYRTLNGFVFRAAPYVFIGNTVTVWGGISLGFAF